MTNVPVPVYSKQLTVYYAHPLTTYGSMQEKMDMVTLDDMGLAMINPNDVVHDMGYREEGMDYFEGLVKECDGLAFRAFPDGSIPAGIAKEIEWTLDNGGFVIELPSARHRRELTVEETREFLLQSGRKSQCNS